MIDALVKRLPRSGEHKVIQFERRVVRALNSIVLRNSPARLPVKFKRPDRAADIVFVNGRSGLRICLFKLFVKRRRSVFRRKPLQLSAVFCIRLGFGEIDGVCYGLDIEAGSPDQHRYFAPGIDILHRLSSKLLKRYNIKFLLRFEYVDQMMRNPLPFFRPDFCCPDIHAAVHLHGIRRNNFSVRYA